MKRTALRFIFLSLAIFGARDIYAQDYYVYCKAKFASNEYSPQQTIVTRFGIEDIEINHYRPPVKEQIILYSPIFKINYSKDKSPSSDNFMKAVLNDLRVKGTFVNENITNKRGPIDGWCMEKRFTSFNEAKKNFDEDYESSKNNRESFMGQILENRCKAIGIYSWTPENLKALYPIQKAGTLVQRCDPNEAPKYK